MFLVQDSIHSEHQNPKKPQGSPSTLGWIDTAMPELRSPENSVNPVVMFLVQDSIHSEHQKPKKTTGFTEYTGLIDTAMSELRSPESSVNPVVHTPCPCLLECRKVSPTP